MPNETQNTIGVWSESLNTDLYSQTKKLIEEVQEFEADIANGDLEHAAEELADVVIVAFGIAFKMGFSLLKQVNKKMIVNRTRNWHIVKGVIRHV